MIALEHEGRRVRLAALGEFSLDDFTEFEEFLLDNNLLQGGVDLLCDLTQMADITIDAALEEIRFTRTHGDHFRRIAVVTSDGLLAWITWLERLFTPADVAVFDSVEEAAAWLDEEDGA